MLGAELVRDLSHTFSVPVRDIHWSEETAQVLRHSLESRFESGYTTLRYLLCEDLSKVDVFELPHSEDLYREIVQVAKKIVDEGPEAVLRKPAQAFAAVEQAPLAPSAANVIFEAQDED